jgi:hypothetical protein
MRYSREDPFEYVSSPKNLETCKDQFNVATGLIRPTCAQDTFHLSSSSRTPQGLNELSNHDHKVSQHSQTSKGVAQSSGNCRKCSSSHQDTNSRKVEKDGKAPHSSVLFHQVTSTRNNKAYLHPSSSQYQRHYLFPPSDPQTRH